jgi:hypothetical protein
MKNPLEILEILLTKANKQILKELNVDLNDLSDIGIFKTDSKWETIKKDKSNEYQIGFILDNGYDASDIYYKDMIDVLKVLKNNNLL